MQLALKLALAAYLLSMPVVSASHYLFMQLSHIAGQFWDSASSEGGATVQTLHSLGLLRTVWGCREQSGL